MWIIFIIPIVVHGILVKQNEHVEIDYKITYDNHCQGDTHRIQTYHGVTISDCVTECGLRSHCKALNYHGQMGVCELFTEVDTKFTPGGCIHAQQKDIHVKKLPCGNGCNLGEACGVKTGTCIIRECMNFPNLTNGVVLGNHKEVGMKIMTKCDTHFKHKNGIKQSTCEQDGTWKPHVECKRDCGELSTPRGVTVVTDSSDTLEGSTILYSCLPDRVFVNGSLTRACQNDGTWNGTEPVCLQDCGELLTPLNAMLVTDSDTLEGSEIIYACQPTFGLDDGTLTRVCQPDGFWSGKQPTCKKDCGELSKPPGTIVVTDNSTLEGAERQYECMNNLMYVSGALSRICQPDGSWNGTEPICTEAVCTSRGTCYALYRQKDLPDNDIAVTEEVSFDKCSEFCETITPDDFKSIILCASLFGPPYNCYCKGITVPDGNQLEGHRYCNFYHRL